MRITIFYRGFKFRALANFTKDGTAVIKNIEVINQTPQTIGAEVDYPKVISLLKAKAIKEQEKLKKPNHGRNKKRNRN